MVPHRPEPWLQIVWAHHARCFGKQAVDYIMGSTGRSYVIGWGENPPTQPHHRNAFCAYVLEGQFCDDTQWTSPAGRVANELTGALIGGPSLNLSLIHI